jgi:two-component system phosphate regulon sensor histidine kinase PhoR
MIASSPRNIALTNAFFISLIATVAIGFISLMSGTFEYTLLLVFFLVVFISAFVIIKYSIDKFIFEKLKIIYQTIGKLKTKSEIKSKQQESGDVLDIVNQAVLEWSEEQKKEIAELKRMAHYRREFLGNVSHELKTPIYNIQGYILTLLDGGLKDDEVNIKFLKRAKKSVNRMIAIVDDLEEISRFESGNLQLKKEIFDIDELIRDVVEYMELKAKENNAAIRVSLLSNQNYAVKADIKRTRQVLINLVDNAIKYGNQDDGKVVISVYDFHDYFLVEISDNGIGIPEEYLFRVFERFFRTDQARSRQKGGSGLGLAIVKHIIEAHNQKISVRNNPDGGSTFSFSVDKG